MADLDALCARAGGSQDTVERPPAIAAVQDDPAAVLPAMDVAGRSHRLRERFDADPGDETGLDIDVLVVTDPANIRYLTGFTGSNATLVVRRDELVFVTDGRYTEQAATQLGGAGVEAEIVITRETVAAVAAATVGRRRIGLEAASVTWGMQRAIAGAVTGEVVPTVDAVETLRLIKDVGELARLARAASIADRALAEVRGLLAERPTERMFARTLEAAMADLGSAAPSFETIVGSGPNGARPHQRPTDRIVGSSGAPELVVLDFGATVDGYHSDMTRTLCIGEPTDTQARMLAEVATAQHLGIDVVAAGVATRTIDAACRDHLTAAGWGEAFVHGTGHGTGVVIHEAPWVRAESDEVLAAGNSVTVEPGVYLAEHGGVRVEDSVVVAEDGCWTLTRSPYAIVP